MIRVETLQGSPLTFSKVESYEIKDGLVIFRDKLLNKEMVFHGSRVQIEEEIKK